ncbi:MAG: dolichyl-phosphate beta-glucosyltransferase [Bacteroidota bacterium]
MKKIKNSIIVPIYNEEKRMGMFLKELIQFSKKSLKNYEILFVDDGSTDNTLELLKNIKKNNDEVKIISYKINKGKGHAVKTGVLSARGDKVLFIDADGSIAPNEIPPMLDRLEKYDIVVGTRYSKRAKVKQPTLRHITGTLFNLYVNLLFHINIYDNLCGFKGFRKRVVNTLFQNLISKRWIFDVELFYKIRKNKYSLYEMPIKWEYKENTKMSVLDPFKMLFQLIKLRFQLKDER